MLYFSSSRKKRNKTLGTYGISKIHKKNIYDLICITSSISALAAPYISRALSTIILGSPNLSEILIAFERPAVKSHSLSCSYQNKIKLKNIPSNPWFPSEKIWSEVILRHKRQFTYLQNRAKLLQ
jgi:hypothetical protein